MLLNLTHLLFYANRVLNFVFSPVRGFKFDINSNYLHEKDKFLVFYSVFFLCNYTVNSIWDP